MDEPIPVLRWQCPCGRFVAEADIDSRDVADPGSYYGVRTETRYRCSRCGVRNDLPWLTEVTRTSSVPVTGGKDQT